MIVYRVQWYGDQEESVPDREFFFTTRSAAETCQLTYVESHDIDHDQVNILIPLDEILIHE